MFQAIRKHGWRLHLAGLSEIYQHNSMLISLSDALTHKSIYLVYHMSDFARQSAVFLVLLNLHILPVLL